MQDSQESPRQHIKAKKMHLLGCGGMLRVKQTLERLQLNSFNGQPNTPSFCSVEKHDLKRFKLVPRTLQRLVHASLSNHKHPIRLIGSGYSIHVTDH